MKTPLKILWTIASILLMFSASLYADNPPKKDKDSKIAYNSGLAPVVIDVSQDFLILESGYYFVRIFDMQGHLIDQYIAYFEASSVITGPIGCHIDIAPCNLFSNV